MHLAVQSTLKLQSTLDRLLLTQSLELQKAITYPKPWVQTFNTLAYFHQSHQSCGWLNGIAFNFSEMLQAGADIYSLFNQINVHTRLAYYALTHGPLTNKRDPSLVAGVIYLSEFFLDKEMRGQGLGSQILQRLPQHLQNLLKFPLTHLFLFPLPIEKGPTGSVMANFTNSNQQQRLINFYCKNGFYQTNFQDYGLHLLIKELPAKQPKRLNILSY